MAIEKLPGWFNFKATYDRALENAKDGDIFVEIGVCYGRSLAYLARRAMDLGKKITIYGVDPWFPDTGDDNVCPQSTASIAKSLGGPFGAAMAMMFKETREELERVNILRLPSVQASRLFDDGSLAMVFIDGDHSYAAVKADILAWRSKVKEGGILAGDDFSDGFPGVKKAVLECTSGPLIQGSTWRAFPETERIDSFEPIGHVATGNDPIVFESRGIGILDDVVPKSVSSDLSAWIERGAIVESMGGSRWLGLVVEYEEGCVVVVDNAYELAPFKTYYPIPVAGETTSSIDMSTGEMELKTAWRSYGVPGPVRVRIEPSAVIRIRDLDPESQRHILSRIL